MIAKLDAVCLLVRDVSKSRKFYEKQLELTVSNTDKGFVEFKLGETPLAIFQEKDAVAMFPTKYMQLGGGAVIALRVADVAQECQKLESKGVKIFEQPKRTSWGQSVAYLHDPDGYIIELTSY